MLTYISKQRQNFFLAKDMNFSTFQVQVSAGSSRIPGLQPVVSLWRGLINIGTKSAGLSEVPCIPEDMRMDFLCFVVFILGLNGINIMWGHASCKGETRDLWIYASLEDRSLFEFHFSGFWILEGIFDLFGLDYQFLAIYMIYLPIFFKVASLALGKSVPVKQSWSIWVKWINTYHKKTEQSANCVHNYTNPGYGLSLVDTLWNAGSNRQPLEQEGNPMT